MKVRYSGNGKRHFHYWSHQSKARSSETLEGKAQSHSLSHNSSFCQIPHGLTPSLPAGPAGAQPQVHLLSGLPPASDPQHWSPEDLAAPGTNEESLPFLLPEGQTRLRSLCRSGMDPRPRRHKPSPCSMRWPSSSSPTTAHRRLLLPGTGPSWTQSALHSEQLCALEACRTQAVRLEGTPLMPADSLLAVSRYFHAIMLCLTERKQPLCLGGCEGRSLQSHVFIKHLARKVTEPGMRLSPTWKWFLLANTRITYGQILTFQRFSLLPQWWHEFRHFLDFSNY